MLDVLMFRLSPDARHQRKEAGLKIGISLIVLQHKQTKKKVWHSPYCSFLKWLLRKVSSLVFLVSGGNRPVAAVIMMNLLCLPSRGWETAPKYGCEGLEQWNWVQTRVCEHQDYDYGME